MSKDNSKKLDAQKEAIMAVLRKKQFSVCKSQMDDFNKKKQETLKVWDRLEKEYPNYLENFDISKIEINLKPNSKENNG